MIIAGLNLTSAMNQPIVARLRIMGHVQLRMGCVVGICCFHTCSRITKGHHSGTTYIRGTYGKLLAWLHIRITGPLSGKFTGTHHKEWLMQIFDGFCVVSPDNRGCEMWRIKGHNRLHYFSSVAIKILECVCHRISHIQYAIRWDVRCFGVFVE